ncbi:hypothetical protein [Streptomyces tsukubensis]|uniref:hypothetical protein n=1 Tax=Streptomyces tsukubensis TaxID=83656 RepID=UPI00386EEE2A
MPVLLPDHLAGESLGLQQRGDLVGVDRGGDAVGQFGGEPVHRLAPRSSAGHDQGQGVLVGDARGMGAVVGEAPQGQGVLVGGARGAGAVLGEAQGQRVLFRAARLQPHGSAHPAALLTGDLPAVAGARSSGAGGTLRPPDADSSR